MTKKFVTVVSTDMDLGDLGGPIDEVITFLHKLKNKAEQEGLSELVLEPWGGHDNSGFSLFGERLETDEEYDKRFEAEAKRLRKQEEDRKNRQIRDLKELERIQKENPEWSITIRLSDFMENK